MVVIPPGPLGPKITFENLSSHVYPINILSTNKSSDVNDYAQLSIGRVFALTSGYSETPRV